MGSHWRLVQLRGGADPSDPLVIRLRLPDGSTKRLQMSKTDTLQDLCNNHLVEELSKLDTDSVKLEVGGHVQSLQQALLNTSSFAAIGLKAGDWITVSATAITQPSLSTSEVKKKVSTSASKKRKLQTVADLDNARSALLKLKREKSTTQVQLRPSTERIVNRIFHSNSKNSLGLLFAPKKPAKASSSRPKPQKGSKKAVEEDEQPEKKVHEIVAIFELSPNHGIEDIKKVIGLAAACQLDCVGLLVAQSNASSTSLWAAKECLTALAFTQALNMPRDSVVLM